VVWRLNSEGVVMGKKILFLIVLALIVYGIWSMVNMLGVKIRYSKIVDSTKSIVKYTSNDTDEKIRRKLKDRATDAGLTLTDEDIEITRFDANDITIHISYPDSAVLPLSLKTFNYDQEIEVSKGDVEE